MSEQSPPPTSEGPMGPDGPHRRDGRQRQAWGHYHPRPQPIVSLDGRRVWDGHQWQPREPAVDAASESSHLDGEREPVDRDWPPSPSTESPDGPHNGDGSVWAPPGFKGIGVALTVLIVISLAITAASHRTTNNATAGTNPTTRVQPAGTGAPSQHLQAVTWKKALDPHLADLGAAETASNCIAGFTAACIASEQAVLAAAKDVQAALKAASAPDCMRPAVADLATAMDLTIQAVNLQLNGLATSNLAQVNAGTTLASQAVNKVSAATDERDTLLATACK